MVEMSDGRLSIQPRSQPWRRNIVKAAIKLAWENIQRDGQSRHPLHALSVLKALQEEHTDDYDSIVQELQQVADSVVAELARTSLPDDNFMKAQRIGEELNAQLKKLRKMTKIGKDKFKRHTVLDMINRKLKGVSLVNVKDDGPAESQNERQEVKQAALSLNMINSIAE